MKLGEGYNLSYKTLISVTKPKVLAASSSFPSEVAGWLDRIWDFACLATSLFGKAGKT
jgi:hypothetical protein